MTAGDTIAAIATAPGRGGVAVVRVSGPDAAAVAEKLTGRPADAGRASVRKFREPGDASRVLDEGVVLFFKAPRSYTGEDVVEFQCHGGTVTPHRVLEACFAAGARLARRGEFTERAFLNGRLDYDQAESVLALVDAKTARAADAALEGLSGVKRRALGELYESALDLSSQLEHALDVDEEELPPSFFESVRSQLAALGARLETALRRLKEGRLLRTGALVVLAGPPNAGKSSLLNALLETDRAIVSDVPGTTRDTIEEGLDLDGWPIRLVDTAGLRETADDIEGEGVKRTEELLSEADVILWLGDGEPERKDRILRIHSKCDLDQGKASPKAREALNVSAKTGEGLEELKRAIVRRLEEKVTDADASESGLDTSPLQEAQALLANLQEADLVLTANVIRTIAERLGSLIGKTYTSDLLENLFTRFCIGK